jgi:hypothetical protein
MKLFGGNTGTEGTDAADRNKMIAAIVLGVLALISLYYAFGRGFFGGSTKAKTTATPKPSATPAQNTETADAPMPSQGEQDFVYATTPIVYNPGMNSAPDAGRNIFAFYEPPVPTPYSPTPYVELPPNTPPPTPTPPMLIAFVSPQSVYAGSKGFRMEVNGTKFTPDSQVYFNQNPVPTTFVTPERLMAEIPASMIANATNATILVRNPSGELYTNQVMMSVNAPPKPDFEYIGLVARKLANNDTAYFQQKGKEEPLRARLNDVLLGRFRLVSISPEETKFVDTQLGFSHTLKLFRPPPSDAPPDRGGFPPATYRPYQPQQPYQMPQQPQQVDPTQEIPGIPNNIPRANQARPSNGIPNKVDPNENPPQPPVDD